MINNFIPAYQAFKASHPLGLTITPANVNLAFTIRDQGEIRFNPFTDQLSLSKPNPNHHIRPLDRFERKTRRLSQALAPPLIPICTINLADVEKYVRFLDNTSYTVQDYDQVRNNEYWQNIYDVASRRLPRKVGAVTNDPNDTSTILSVPCVGCGFVFRLSNITIDHQRPQTGGVLAAILKVFRAMGLTVDGASGFKGQQVFGMVTNEYLLRTAKAVSAPAPPALRGNRYQLNDRGLIVYSILEYMTSQSVIQQACMHNLCNLAPLCNSCNSAKGNTWIP